MNSKALLGFTSAIFVAGALSFASVQAAQVKSIAILVPEAGTDYGWNQQGVEAAREVANKYNLKFMPAEGLGYGDVHPTLRELASDGAGLIIAHASGYSTRPRLRWRRRRRCPWLSLD